jgi:hypothetical protein
MDDDAISRTVWTLKGGGRMEFQTQEIPFNTNKQFTHDYSITQAEKNALVQSFRNPVLNILELLQVPNAVQGDALRLALSSIERLVNAALSVTPKLSVYYVVQGSCENLAAAKIRLVPTPEIIGPTGAFSTTVYGVGLAIKYSPSLESSELETTFIECQIDDEDGVKKGVRFLYKLRLKFEVNIGPLTLTPVIAKDDTQLVTTPCCEDYELDDFEDVEFARAPKQRRGKEGKAVASKGKQRKTIA